MRRLSDVGVVDVSGQPRIGEVVIEGSEYTTLWDRFDAALSFKPAAWRYRQPVIAEPAGSITFDLQHAHGTWAVHAINALVV